MVFCLTMELLHPDLEIVAFIHPVEPVPVLENVDGFEPWLEFLEMLLLVLQTILVPWGCPETV